MPVQIEYCEKLLSFEKAAVSVDSLYMAEKKFLTLLEPRFCCRAAAIFPEETAGLRSGSAGSSGVAERSGTERSNELRLAAKGGHSDGKGRACAVFAGPPEFLVIRGVVIF